MAMIGAVAHMPILAHSLLSLFPVAPASAQSSANVTSGSDSALLGINPGTLDRGSSPNSQLTITPLRNYDLLSNLLTISHLLPRGSRVLHCNIFLGLPCGRERGE